MLKTCITCGIAFSGYPASKFCPDCAAIRKREMQHTRIHRFYSGESRPLGSTGVCVLCGQEYVVKSGMQKYCPECAAKKLSPKPKVPKEVKICPVCGNQTTNKMYCSRQCRAEATKNYKSCVVCGNKFYCPPANTVYCCSPACSSQYRSELAKNRNENIEHINIHRDLYVKNHQGELHPHSKHYGILTPTGEVIDVLNLHHWVLNCGLFEKPQSAYTAFLNIVGTLKGTTSQKRRSYAGYSIVYYDDGNAANSKANLAEQKFCKVCGTPLPSIKRSYCSEECRKAAIKLWQKDYRKNKKGDKK